MVVLGLRLGLAAPRSLELGLRGAGALRGQAALRLGLRRTSPRDKEKLRARAKTVRQSCTMYWSI